MLIKKGGFIISKEFIWKGDYTDRGDFFNALSYLIENHDASVLEYMIIYINNVYLNQELYVRLGYSDHSKNEINEMHDHLNNAGAEYKTNISSDVFMEELKNKRFDLTTVMDKDHLEQIKNNMFHYRDRAELESLGYKVDNPLESKNKIFLSHQSGSKKEIRDLISSLASKGFTVWFDENDIDFGDSITEEIQKGIMESEAVIFWISNKFLESGWCNAEFQSFLSKKMSNNNVLILPILESDLDINKYNEKLLFLNNYKYLKMEEGEDATSVFKKILPTLKKLPPAK